MQGFSYKARLLQVRQSLDPSETVIDAAPGVR